VTLTTTGTINGAATSDQETFAVDTSGNVVLQSFTLTVNGEVLTFTNS
jgi:hypothetical protein